jgi:predicted ATPase/class 3 adenylate cyclase
MHRVVPELIVENYREARHSGEFLAVGMFLDLSGFSTMTDTLMHHGQHGAEVLSALMHGVFDPLVESIFDYGGKIVGFAGDGIMALYPVDGDARSTALRALASASIIQKRFLENPTRETEYGKFSISAKLGLAIGSVSWGILCSATCDQATYYFRGSAVDESADAEHHARAGDILLTANLRELLGTDIKTTPFGSHQRFGEFCLEMPAPSPVFFPPVDLEIARLFMPEEVIAHDVRGEFRQVVNLFMRFPDLTEEQLRSLITTIFDLREKYGGLLNRLDFGDKGCNMLMLWGAPVAYENDVRRALTFLLDLRSAVDFPITAGVTYYIAHAGYLGSVMCEDYTCYGWGVNLASRFMMSAPIGEIWVDDRIARRVSRRFDIEFVGSQMFKGFAAEQKVHRLLRHKETVEPIYHGELVGREEELAQLANFTEPLRQGRFAGLLLVTGDAGIGKGRLVYEFRSSKLFEEKSILWAVCQSDQILRQSFNPLRNWLWMYFGFTHGQPVEQRKQAFDKKLGDLLVSIPDTKLANELDRTRSILGALIDLRWEDSLYEQLDAEGRYNNTFLALIALLKAESLRQPVVLFLEDLQFTDSDSKEFLPRLQRAILASEESYPIAIIVTTRPTGVTLETDLINARIDLRGLFYEPIARLSETMLGGAVDPDLVTLLLNRSEGNPYFVEQIIRFLQEENHLEPSGAGWTLVRRLRSNFLPGDIRSVLVARLDQLMHAVKESVQTASVLGREFEADILVQMLREDGNVQKYIAEAEKAAIWAPLNEIRYIFSHGLLRDAAYEMQMRARRRELHALAVEALETLYPHDLDKRCAELAYHAEYGELFPKAQKYFSMAGKLAAEKYQNHQAIDYFMHALAFTPFEDLRTRFDLLMERVELFNRVGNRPAQLRDLQALKRLADQLNDRQRLANVSMLYARYYFVIGEYPRTVEIAEDVASLSRRLGQEDLALGVYIVWSQALFRLGKLDEALKYAMDGLSLARRFHRRVDEGKCLSSLGLIALESKEPGVAQQYLEEAVAIARETKERTLESRALVNLANAAAFMQQDYITARAYYERADELHVELGDRSQQGIGLGNIGWVCGMVGDFAAAQMYHERALVIAREVGSIYQETYTLMNLSKVAEVQGKADEAIHYALAATDLSKTAEDKTAEAWAYLYLGQAYLLSGQFEAARIAFQSSLHIRQELGQASLATEPIAGLIQVALGLDDSTTAQDLTEELLSFLLRESALDGTEEPLRVYLACYQALERTDDTRSVQILNTARDLLERQTEKLGDAKARHRYIENVPWRRAIASEWHAKSSTS